MQSVFYLCNGEKKDCKKQSCYKRGGECKHTKDVRYAKNFHKKYPQQEKSAFWEEE